MPQTSLVRFGTTAAAAAVLLCGCTPTEPPREVLATVDRTSADHLGRPFDTAALLAADPKAPGPPPTGTLTLDRAVGLTLAHNLSLVASAQNVRLAQAALAQAGLLQNPTFGESNGILFPIAPVMGHTPYDFNLSQELNSLFTRGARIDEAKFQQAQAGLDLASQAFDLAEQVRSKYQELTDDLHSASLARRTANLYDRSLRAAQVQAKLGTAPGADVSRADLQAADARRQLRHLEAQYRRAAQELNWLMGYSSPPAWTLPPGSDDPPADVPPLPSPVQLEDLADRNRIDLVRADFDRKLGRNGVELAQIGLFPQLTVGLDGGQNSDRSGFLGPFFNLTLPIFDPGIVALESAKMTAEKNDRTYTALAGQVRQDVRTAYANLALDQDDLTFYRDQFMPEQEKTVRLAQLAFDQGEGSLNDLLDALRDYVSAQQQFADAITAYHTDAVALERVVGLAERRLVEEARRSPGGATRPTATTRPIRLGTRPTTTQSQEERS